MAGCPREESERLAIFGNALRDMLDLEPIYDTRAGSSHEKTTEERFYMAPMAWPKGRDTGERMR